MNENKQRITSNQIKSINIRSEDNTNNNRHIHTRNQSNNDIQSLIDMCTKKLEIEPNHKKALLLRASSCIKKNELEKVTININCRL
jgi:hypothetical protein